MYLKEAWKKLNLSLPRDPAKKRRTYIFLLCVLCSALFWLVTQLSRDSQAPFSRPVIFGYDGEEFIITNQSDSVIFYNLQATGARLVTKRVFGSRDTLRLDVESLPGIQRFGRSFHYITNEEVNDYLAEYEGQNIFNVRPDTIFVELEEAVERKLPVALNADISFEKRFNLYGEIQIDPDSVLITAPRTLLDTLSRVETRKIELRDLNRSIEKTVPVHIPVDFPPLELSPKEVKVSIPVEEFTEGSVKLNLQVECIELESEFDPEAIRLFPSQVEVVYVVSLKDYQHVDAEMFRAVVRCPSEDLRRGGRLNVELVESPVMVRVQSIRPRSVEYIILE